MKIIYQTKHGTVAVVIPAPNCVLESGKKFKDLTGDELTAGLEELAQRDVPPGLKYKIVEDSVISSDRSFRDAWEVDPADLTDGVGSNFGVTIDPPRAPGKE
jgi:hypothetical protein